MRILLLEDDIVFSEMLEEYLVSLGNNVEIVYDRDSAEEFLYSSKYDLILLDINIPGGDGLELLSEFRNTGHVTSAIIITSFTNIEKIEKAYLLGCNDYLKKPFEFRELHARISYIDKIHKINHKGQINICKNIVFDSLNMEIIKNKQSIKLPKKEAEIIKYFLFNKNRIISIDELTVNLWNYDTPPSIATIRTYIKNIRRTLDLDFVENIKGIGYRFNTTF
jgi:DNA-binding response OmpR family regulator